MASKQRSLLSGLAAAVLVILGAELLLRALHVEAWMPSLMYGDVDLYWEVADLAEMGTALDLLVMGSSEVEYSVDPAQLSAALPAEAEVLRLDFDAATPYSARLLLEYVVPQYADPPVVVYGLSPRDLNEADPYGAAANALRSAAPMMRALRGADWDAGLVAFGLQHVYLYRYGGVIGAMVDSLIKADIRRLENPPRDPAGVIRLPLFETPPHLESIREGVQGFDLEGPYFGELDALVAYCAAQNIQLVLYLMPIYPDAFTLYDGGRADYDAFANYVRQAAAAHDLPVFDGFALVEGGVLTAGHFQDYNHLNRYGQEILTDRLAGALSRLALNLPDG
ncbi:MAG: SGNH/GDSL hydrolase family protein [Anaerolineae bacterium]|nr:SGNH/GDSL hydrolase family protein [Anaerolineae bacterium]